VNATNLLPRLIYAWSSRGSNSGPLPCKGSALPLRHNPALAAMKGVGKELLILVPSLRGTAPDCFAFGLSTAFQLAQSAQCKCASCILNVLKSNSLHR
jgi:hypothetical protein